VEPSRDPNHLFELTRERLERLELPAPVLHLLLLAPELPPFVPRGADLFDAGSRESLPLPRLLERLRARLGAGAVRELRCLPDHRPERASRMDPDFALGAAADGYVAAYAVREAAQQEQAAAGERPCWMLDAPVAIDCAQFHLTAGPERIESGWWDEADVSRDYYRAERRDGAVGWIYRERRAPHGWYLHGLFG
jgi:protein ImuB